jgi:hypothetical protein
MLMRGKRMDMLLRRRKICCSCINPRIFLSCIWAIFIDLIDWGMDPERNFLFKSHNRLFNELRPVINRI